MQFRNLGNQLVFIMTKQKVMMLYNTSSMANWSMVFLEIKDLLYKRIVVEFIWSTGQTSLWRLWIISIIYHLTSSTMYAIFRIYKSNFK